MKRKILLILFALFLAGCGSSDNAFTSNPGLSVPTDSGDRNQLFGRALLDGPMVGGTVELVDSNGQVLIAESALVDDTGNFRVNITDRTLPPSFLVRVTPPAGSPWDLPVLSRVESSDPIVFANILTTLAAKYQNKRGVSEDEATSWVRSKFQIPESVDLGFGIEESRHSPFTHSQFLTDAASRGGPAAYVDALLADVNAQVGEIAEVTAIEKFGSALGSNLGANIFNLTAGNVIGTAAESLGINVGNSNDIQALGEQITDLQSQVAALSSQVQADFKALSTEVKNVTAAATLVNDYNTQTGNLEQPISDIKVLTMTLATDAGNANLTNQPFTPDSAVTKLLSDLGNFTAATDLQMIADNLLGQNNLSSLLVVYRQLRSYGMGIAPQGLTSPATAPVWGNSPVLSNGLVIDPLQDFLDSYSAQETLAFNLLVENANASQDVDVISSAQSSGQTYFLNLVQQQALVPPPLASDFFLSNPQAAFETRTKNPKPSSPSGTLFYGQLQGFTSAYRGIQYQYNPLFAGYDVSSDEGQGFIQETTAFQAGNLSSGWRLMSYDEAVQLSKLATTAGGGNVLIGLENLGFNISGNETMSPQLPVWVYDPDDQAISGDSASYGGLNIILQDQNAPIKVYDLVTGSYTGQSAQDAFDMYREKLPYIQVHYQSFASNEPYNEVLAAGFRAQVAPTLSLSSDGSKVQATLGGQDVSLFCSWTSSSDQLEVSNNPAFPGKLTWHPQKDGALQARTITATLPGMVAATGEATTFSPTISVPVPTPAPTRSLQGINVVPTNLSLTNVTNVQYSALGFFSDNTVQDVTGSVVWSIEDSNGNPYPSSVATITGSTQGALVFTGGTITEPIIKVIATAGSIVGTTEIKVATGG